MQFYCPAQQSGDLRSLAPPVPIPNTEVKRAFADGSASIGCARVGRCQYHEPRRGKPRRGFFFQAIPQFDPPRVESSYMQEYYYADGGEKPKGPHTAGEIKEL